jgi:hypothetical protein
MGEILGALFPPVAVAVLFVLLIWTMLRSTDWRNKRR